MSMEASSPLSGSSRRPLLALIATAVFGGACLLGYLLWSGYRDALAEAEKTTRNSAWLLEAGFDATLRRLDANLREFVEILPPAAVAKSAVPGFAGRIDGLLDLQVRHFPELSAMRVFDAEGDMIYTSGSAAVRRTNIADRPYFKALRDNPGADVVFSEVLAARASGRPSIVAGRAVYSGGKFIGVIIGLLDIEHFQHLLQSIDVGRQGLIAIRRSDDFTLALRWPMIEKEINQPLPPQNPLVHSVAAGKRMDTLRFTANTDGIDRIFSIRTLERYPYYVVVGLASEEVLHGWRNRALLTGAIGALLLGLLGFVLLRLVAAEARMGRVVADLADSSRLLLDKDARLDEALEISGMADCSYDIAAGCFDLNDRFYRLLRRTREDEDGRLDTAEFIARLVHPEDATRVDAILARAQAMPDAGAAPDESLRLRCGDGSVRWMQLRLQRAPAASGPARLIGTLLDIHERRNAEQATRDLSAFRAAMFEAADYSIISTTPTGIITSFNLAAERMLGYRAEEVIGKVTPALIHDGVEVAARAVEFSTELGIAIEPGFEVFVVRSRQHLPNTYEWTYVRKDGSRFPVLLSVTALRDDSGAIYGFLGIAADITVQRLAVAALHESEAALNAAQSVARIGSWTLDIVSSQLRWSAETHRIFGIAAETPLTYALFLDRVHPDDRPMLNAAWQAALAGEPYDIEHRLVVDGQVRWVRERARIEFDAAGAPRSGVGTVQEITERKAAELRLQLLAGVFQHSGEALMVTDHANDIIEINPAFTRMTGYSLDEVRGRNPRFLASGRTPGELYGEMWGGLATDDFWQGEVWDRRKDGGVYPKRLTITVIRDGQGQILHHVASFADITEQKATEERIRHLALHDPLTGLPNRLDLQGRMEQALAAARRDQTQLAIMFIDLDRFKQINDNLGHAVGDLLLIDVAHRLKACVRDADVVARIGGDEFVVVLPNVADSVVAGQVADKIVATLDEPYSLEGHQVESSPSIGIALFPADGDNEEVLLKRADEAMYRAKSLGRNNWQFYVS